MNNILLSAVNGGPDNRYRVEMGFDDMCENPRNHYDPLWHLRFAGSDFGSLSDYRREYDPKTDKFKNMPDILPPYMTDELADEHVELKEKGWTIVPIKGYSHSGITISVVGGGQYDDRWDGGICGFAYLDPDSAKDMTPTQAMKILHEEIEELDCYARGECYYFRLYVWGNEVEASYNYVGDDRKIRRDYAKEFGAEFTPLFTELAYDRIDPEIDFSCDNAAMEAYAI